jgi:hypothetical protein
MRRSATPAGGSAAARSASVDDLEKAIAEFLAAWEREAGSSFEPGFSINEALPLVAEVPALCAREKVALSGNSRKIYHPDKNSVKAPKVQM